MPLHSEQQRDLFSKFTAVIRATVKGNIVVAIVQGALGGIIFWLLGVHALEASQFWLLTLAADAVTLAALASAAWMLSGTATAVLCTTGLYAIYPLAVQQSAMYYPTSFQVASIAVAIALMLSAERTSGGRRLAIAHTLVKTLGAFLTLFFFPAFIAAVNGLSTLLSARSSLPIRLAIAHTLFNVLNVTFWTVASGLFLRVLRSITPADPLSVHALPAIVRRMLAASPDRAETEVLRQMDRLRQLTKVQLDDAIDQMQQTAKAVMLFEVRTFEPPMREIGSILVQCANLVGRAVPLMQSMGENVTTLTALTEEITRLEGRVDDLDLTNVCQADDFGTSGAVAGFDGTIRTFGQCGDTPTLVLFAGTLLPFVIGMSSWLYLAAAVVLGAGSSCRMDTALRMGASGLRSSCASMARNSFMRLAECSSSLRRMRSLMSRVTLAKPSSTPLAWMGVTTMLAQKVERSLRTRQPSTCVRPCSSASSTSPATTSSRATGSPRRRRCSPAR